MLRRLPEGRGPASGPVAHRHGQRQRQRVPAGPGPGLGDRTLPGPAVHTGTPARPPAVWGGLRTALIRPDGHVVGQ
ncbi:hypothetical protein GCM10010145_43330 [Streptomyces ruber]|uniref:Uncharacterized protein n=2 Tax=Streptomyces TaxID=1883 RepID=A0A918BIQ5_9ACTN|nr:hypothetical protein GCM10010145_43330 [Streptomyces ruber]